jgi:hypothetical protein
MPGEDGPYFKTLSPKPGTYHINAVGEQEVLLEGAVYYEEVQNFRENGHSYSILKFHLSPLGNNTLHSLGFYITQERGVWPQGTYKMANDIDGFFHPFDGVFAFADIDAMGEQPFFAESGNLTINYSAPEAIGGTLAMTMLNARGQTVAIKGDFMASLRD